MKLPDIPLNAEIQIKVSRESILLLAMALACVVAFGILMSKLAKRN